MLSNIEDMKEMFSGRVWEQSQYLRAKEFTYFNDEGKSTGTYKYHIIRNNFNFIDLDFANISPVTTSFYYFSEYPTVANQKEYKLTAGAMLDQRYPGFRYFFTFAHHPDEIQSVSEIDFFSSECLNEPFFRDYEIIDGKNVVKKVGKY